ncbi:transposase [Streptomyces microflavus]|uniref:transposase n=1 Tax=Streptomyces microflavus TaxID=1919 RepID=UPI003678FFD2
MLRTWSCSGVDVDRLRAVPAGLPLPRFEGGRPALAVDVSPWLRSDSPCSAERSFCHAYGRAKSASQFFPGGSYSFVAVLEPGATSWTSVLDVVVLGPKTMRQPSPAPSSRRPPASSSSRASAPGPPPKPSKGSSAPRTH